MILILFPKGAVAEFHGRAAYSAAYAKLNASTLDAWGWSVKNDELVSMASGAELELQWGPKWYQYFYIEGYSTQGLLPVEIGSGDDEISASSFGALFGLTGSWIPAIKISTIQFDAVAYSYGTLPIYQNGQELQEGDEFDVGLTYSTYLLIWGTPKEGTGAGESEVSFQFGVGAAHISFLGVKQEYQPDGSRPVDGYTDEVSEGWGFEIYNHVSYGSKEIYENTTMSVGALVEIAMLDVGAMMKVGYEAALNITPMDNLVIRPYAGGYFWPFLNWQDDFAAVESDLGYMLGVQANYFW